MLELRRETQQSGKHTILTIIMTVAVILALTGIAGATPIPGVSIGWNGGNLSVAVSSTCINFYTTSIDVCPPGSGSTFTLNAPSDAVFGTVGTTTGTTKDYLMSNQPVTTPGVQTYNNGGAFIVLNGNTFDVQSINVPNAVPCPPGATPGSCSILDFVLTQNDLFTSGGACPGGVGLCGHVTVSFSTNGRGYVTGSDPVTTGSTPFTFIYSSQFNNETTTDLAARAAAGTLTNSLSITATPGAGVPEPMALSLVGLGLVAIGGFGRLRRAWAKRA